VTALPVTEHDFAIEPAVTSLPAGLIDLAVTDRGPSAHEMLIFQTDLPADKRPRSPDGRVDESGGPQGVRLRGQHRRRHDQDLPHRACRRPLPTAEPARPASVLSRSQILAGL
jgi:hypothetical protein